MGNFDILDKRLHELLEVSLQACEDLDKSDRGISNYVSDGNSREMCRLSLNLFNIFIANSDNDLDEREIGLINSIAGTNFGSNELKKIIDKAGIHKENYAKQIPVILRVFVDADNSEDKSAGNSSPLSIILYDLFATSGVYVMAVDERIRDDEYEYLTAYLQTMYKFLKKNLKFGFHDIKKPETLITEILNQAEIDLSEQMPKKSKKIKNHEEESKEEAEEEETLEELLAELNSMIGLDEVKYDVTSLMNLLRIRIIREQMGLEMPPVSMHLVFSGNPGTGKTTVARLLAKIYKKIGVLSKGQLIEVDRSGLVGGYVGQTALKVGEVIKSAIGGVLFIDEAYSLTPENVVNDYGLEAVDTLVKSMEDHRENLVVIVAGYSDLMKHFLSSNPGLKSRFNKFISFRDYTPEELTEIFSLFCKKSGYRVSMPALEYVKTFFEDRCDKKEKNFANAREVRNLFEYALSRQANRVVLISNPTQNDITLLKRADVSGENIDMGKQQYMAQLVINDLSRKKRYGLGTEYMDVWMDELELSAAAEEMLSKNGIDMVRDFLDYLDSGKTISQLDGISQEIEDEILEELSKIGFSM